MISKCSFVSRPWLALRAEGGACHPACVSPRFPQHPLTGPSLASGGAGSSNTRGPGDKVAPRPHSPFLVPVAGSSLSRWGHVEAATELTVPLLRCRLLGLLHPLCPFRCRSSAVEKLSRDGGTDGRREGRKERRREEREGRGRAGVTAGGQGAGAEPGGDSGHPNGLACHASVPRAGLCALNRPGRVQPAPSSTATHRPFKKVGEGSAARFRPPS